MNAIAWQELQGAALKELACCLSDPMLCGEVTRADNSGSLPHQAAEVSGTGAGLHNSTACTPSVDACSSATGDTVQAHAFELS